MDEDPLIHALAYINAVAKWWIMGKMAIFSEKIVGPPTATGNSHSLYSKV